MKRCLWMYAILLATSILLTACSGEETPAAPTQTPAGAVEETPAVSAHAPGEEYDVSFWFMIGNTDVRNLTVYTYGDISYYKYTDTIVNGVVAQPLLIETGLVGNGTIGNMMPAKVCRAARSIDADNGDTGIVVAVDEDAFGAGVRALNIAGASNYRAYTYVDSKLTQGDAVWNITEETNILIGTKFILTPDFDLYAENGELPAAGYCAVFPRFDDPSTALFVAVNTYSNFNAPQQGPSSAQTLPPVPDGLDMSFELTAKHIDTQQIKGLGFWLYTPVDAGEGMPMILYLHGGGIKGNDLEAFYDKSTIAGYLAEGRVHVPAYVVIPQLPGNQETWADIGEALKELVEYMIDTYHVDADRVSMTGHSMGGIGTFDLAVRYPELFCSVAPMSGIMDNTAENLRALENIPVWCFVGSADNMVKPARSVPFMTALMERNPEARLTTIEGAGHGEVFTHAVTLDEYGVWDWLLSYSKGN